MFMPIISRIGQADIVRSGRSILKLNYYRNLTNKIINPVAWFSRGSAEDEEGTRPLVAPFIPAYQQKNQNESVETIKSRLLYQSRKRGMLENDLLLSTFAAKYLGSMNEEELKDYDHLINCPSNDWDIYYWATGVKPVPLEFDTPIMKKFIEHVQNKNRDVRLRQPDLEDRSSQSQK